MLIDTHCHINNIVKKEFDIPLNEDDCQRAKKIIDDAALHEVMTIINVGTSLVESYNSIMLAQRYQGIFASVGVHPNDCGPTWKDDLNVLASLVAKKEDNKIVAIGECGLDFHYPGYDLQRQKDAFRAHIELALAHNLPLVIHTRDAGDEVLTILAEYRSSSLRGVIHCFSENLSFAHKAIELGFVLGIGGTITYPKNNHLRETVLAVGIEQCVLETDAPFLPPQHMRGQQNLPQYIQSIAHYIAKLLNISYDHVSEITTRNARRIFDV